MAAKTVGIAVPAPDPLTALSTIRRADEMGVPAAWMTSGGNAGDPLMLFAAAATQTQHIRLGASILQLWSRHPVTTARQMYALAAVAPDRVRLGVGPGHKQPMERTFGVDFHAPLGHLREYLKIVKGLLQDSSIDLDGQYHTAHATVPQPVDVPVMASALRPTSFELCGEEADGAISWVCPLSYLRDVALPTMRQSAEKAGRPAPPLVVHVPMCVHEDIQEAREGVRRQLGYFPSTPFYARMFAAAGFPDSGETGWTDEMLDAVMIAGDEDTVAGRINEVFDWGASEILATPVTVGDNPQASMERTMRLLAQVSSS